MRAIFLFSIFIVVQNIHGQIFTDNSLLILSRNALSIFNTNTNDSLIIKILPSTEKWVIGSASVSNDTVTVLIYASLDYLNFNIDKTLREKELLFHIDNPTKLLEKENRINEIDGELFIISGNRNSMNLNHSNLFERYNYTRDVYSIDGDLYLLKDNEKCLFLSRNVVNKAQCGYFQPVLSFNEKLLICEYQCSKFNGKKQSRGHELIEIEVKTKTITKLHLYGYNPSYSPDGNFILYQNTEGYNLYSKIRNKNLNLKGITQALWVK
jgi:hypothetical protein